MDIEPKIAVIETGRACEFEVVLTPMCSFQVQDRVVLVSQKTDATKTSNVAIKLRAETVVTTQLSFDVIEKQIGEGSFGIVSRGHSEGTLLRSIGRGPSKTQKRRSMSSRRRSRCWTSSGARRSSTSTVRARSTTT